MLKKCNAVEVEAFPYVDIRDELRSGSLIAFSCLNNREIIFGVAKQPLKYREESTGGSFVLTQTPEKQDYRIYQTVDGQVVHVVDVTGENFNIHHIQKLDKDKLLLVCSRCRWFSGDNIECNGRIYDQTGCLENTMTLGDGIQDLQITTQGELWVSYFDEGVFGNYGWNNPLGSSGLVKWSKSGKILYEYDPVAGLSTICDCYALNVETDNITWCYYYTDFPLVKIKNGEIEILRKNFT